MSPTYYIWKNSTNVLFQYISLFLRGITRVTVFENNGIVRSYVFLLLFLIFSIQEANTRCRHQFNMVPSETGGHGNRARSRILTSCLNVWKLTYKIYWQVLPKLVSKYTLFFLLRQIRLKSNRTIFSHLGGREGWVNVKLFMFWS